MSYPRFEMLYQDYEWTGMNTYPTILNRKEGFEVQSFINEIDRTPLWLRSRYQYFTIIGKNDKGMCSAGFKKSKVGATVDDRKLCIERLKVTAALFLKKLSAWKVRHRL
jgi:hypothetical protein